MKNKKPITVLGFDPQRVFTARRGVFHLAASTLSKPKVKNTFGSLKRKIVRAANRALRKNTKESDSSESNNA